MLVEYLCHYSVFVFPCHKFISNYLEVSLFIPGLPAHPPPVCLVDLPFSLRLALKTNAKKEDNFDILLRFLRLAPKFRL